VSDFIGALRLLIALMHLPRWVVPSVIVFGLLGALLEGLSISLVMPLIHYAHPLRSQCWTVVVRTGASGCTKPAPLNEGFGFQQSRSPAPLSTR
jgi:hypothetical protein